MQEEDEKALQATQQLDELRARVEAQGAFEAGHYYSPIPSKDEVRAYLAARQPPGNSLAGIDLNARGQRTLLEEYSKYYPELPFPEEKAPDRRFYYKNDWFSYSDAIYLFCFLRKFRPKRIIEVGSGFSSAVMLDTVDHVEGWNPEINFVEPYPERLNDLIGEADRQRVRLMDRKVQEVPLELFSRLDDGDLLFIDSSHVVKCGSDLQFLLFEVLPRLKPGVFVHFHDVFYPFDYPTEWLEEGRYWNENYFLRAFLSHNDEWRIVFFNTYVQRKFGGYIEHNMPLCARNPGGGLYIRRQRRRRRRSTVTRFLDRPYALRRLIGLVCWVAVAFVAAAIGAVASVDAGSFYQQLARPPWAPPGWLFGPVWTVLYLLMGISAWLVWRVGGVRKAPLALTLFIVQLGANALWSWLFFAWRQGGLALLEIVVLWLLIVSTIIAFWRRGPGLAAMLMLPYLAWVTFATFLTFSIWRLNPALLG